MRKNSMCYNKIKLSQQKLFSDSYLNFFTVHTTPYMYEVYNVYTHTIKLYTNPYYEYIYCD